MTFRYGVAEALLAARVPLEEGGATAKGVGVSLSDAAAEASLGEGVMAAKVAISLGSGVAGDSLGARVAEALLGETGATDRGAGSPVRGGVAGPLLGGEVTAEGVGVPLGDGVAGPFFGDGEVTAGGVKSPFGGGLAGAFLGDGVAGLPSGEGEGQFLKVAFHLQLL